MRSLTLKLTLAFLVVGVAGVALIALFVGQRTQQEFDQFVLDRYQQDLLNDLADYYAATGSWEGINAILVRNQHGNMGRMGHRPFSPAPVVLLDADDTVVYGGQRYQRGQRIAQQDKNQGVPIQVDEKTVGWVLFESPVESIAPVPESPESDFLGRVKQAIFLGALGAIAVALLIGVLLARTISKPVRELTAATQLVAQGELGYQVPVRTEDELGQLTASFNRMSADLARSTELRRQMAADVAHELRTPLSLIMGYAEALSDGKLDGSPETFEILHKEAQRLSRLVGDLRTLSLADAGELSLTRRPIAPRILLERAVFVHATQAQEQDVSLQMEVDQDLPEVPADPDRIAQVLDNLVSNALRHTPAGGCVTLAACADNSEVKVTVTDTGTGIPPEALPHVFDRFWRGEKSRSRAGGGTGLGLAIARQLVELHGGRIGVESSPGEGAEFWFTLPLR